MKVWLRGNRGRIRAFAVFFWWVMSPYAVNAGADAPRRSAIPYPAGLEEQVQFWKDVFTIYTSNHVVIHDREDLNRVYSVLDFSYLDAAGVSPVVAERLRRDRVDNELDRVRDVLTRLQQVGVSSASLNAEELKVAKLFPRGASRRLLREAASKERLRAQTGLAEKFHRAIEVAHSLWPEMERIFRDEGLPVELTRLPLIESGFNLDAYSRVGAAGIWQFMPATGRLYMRIDEAVDARRDPIVATEAAARHLRADYEALGSWPLAITAYNHGRGGMARAVTQVGTTDIVKIIQRYDGGSFGFASKNFFPEFLAALEVERNAGTFFGAVRPAPVRNWRSVTLPHYVRFSALANGLGVSRTELARMNPALSERVVSGDLYVPKGYRLWLTRQVARQFDRAYASLTAAEKHDRQKQWYVVHRVRKGDTLGRLARRYGTTVGAIMRQNGLRNANQIRNGQTLRIPSRPRAARQQPMSGDLARQRACAVGFG